MKGIYTSKMGKVQINSSVIATYAGTIAVECFGIVGMAWVYSRDGGITRLLRGKSLQKGISIDIVENTLNLDFHVIVAYGVSIRAVCENLMENVRYRLSAFTGMEIGEINVYVEGVRVID